MSRFSVKNVLSRSAKKFLGHALGCIYIRVSKKIYASEGYVTALCPIYLSQSAENFLREPSRAVFQKISDSQNF